MSFSGESCARVQLALDERMPISPELLRHLDACSGCRFAVQLSSLFGSSGNTASDESLDSLPAPALQSGNGLLLDRYRLDGVLGRGSQGWVFRATDMKVPGSVVALKLVRLDARSVEEVAHAKGINHPNVCRINYTAEHGAFRLIEMEYVDGPTLAEVLGTLSRKAAADVFRAVCAGMRAVHAHRILHLDLKPTNIMMRRDGTPVIMDFGLSVGPGEEPRGWTRRYAAPELERGRSADTRADVYSLGTILAELVPRRTGAVNVVVARATAARPEDRYPDVETLLFAFDRAMRRAYLLPLGVSAIGLLGIFAYDREPARLRVAVGFVRDGERVLMVRRRQPEGRLRWQFPGGIVKPAQVPEDRVVDEVYEETGIRVSVADKIGERISPDSHVHLMYFNARYRGGEITNKDPGENADVAWVPVREVKHRVTSDLYTGIERLLGEAR